MNCLYCQLCYNVFWFWWLPDLLRGGPATLPVLNTSPLTRTLPAEQGTRGEQAGEGEVRPGEEQGSGEDAEDTKEDKIVVFSMLADEN